MTAFPQYAQSQDPLVLDAVERNRRGWLDFHKRACDFAIAQGVEKGTYYPSSFAGIHRVRAIGGDTKPTTGRWKQGYGGYGWLPFKNNPLTEELEAISFREEGVPGLPDLIRGPNQGWSHILATPHPFIVDGVAFVGFNFAPVVDEYEKNPVQHEGIWTEILASTYARAVETHNERAKAEKD